MGSPVGTDSEETNGIHQDERPKDQRARAGGLKSWLYRGGDEGPKAPKE